MMTSVRNIPLLGTLIRRYEYFNKAESDVAVARNLASMGAPDLSAKCYEDAARHYLSARFLYEANKAFIAAARKYHEASINPDLNPYRFGRLRTEYEAVDFHLTIRDSSGKYLRDKNKTLNDKKNKFLIKERKALTRARRIHRLLDAGRKGI